MDLYAVDPELRLGVIGAVERSGDRIDALDARMDLPHQLARALGRSGVSVDDGGDVLCRAPQPRQRAPQVVAVLVDAGHRQRVERLDDQRSQTADQQNGVGMDPPADRLRAEEAPVMGAGGDRDSPWPS